MSFEGYEKNHILVGPWGGQTGARWDDGVYTTVRQVVVCHGAAIDSIHVEYDKQGTSVWAEKHGGSGTFKTHKVRLNFPEEYIVSISGHYGSLVDFGPVIIRSLTIESNKKKYGPFGIQQGTQFSFPLSGGKVVGFHGRSSWYLDSIGVYLMPLLRPDPSSNRTNLKPITNNSIGTNDKIKGVYYMEDNELKPRPINPTTVVTTTTPTNNATPNQPTNNNGVAINTGYTLPGTVVSYGPWGGDGGTIFNDGVYTGVREVHLTRYGSLISICVCYDFNGECIWGNKNGGNGGNRLDKITFDYPSEVLTHITGYCGPIGPRGPTVVKSITFYTNKTKYGPFGEAQGIPFTSGSNNGGIVVGFHGRKGWFVESVGVHVVERTMVPQPMLVLKPPSRSTYADFNVNNVTSSRSTYYDSNANNVGIQEYETAPVVIVKEPAPAVKVKEPASPWILGPWGGDGGKAWDDGIFNGIQKIFLTKGEAAICSIQVEYDRNGQSFWSPRHGGPTEGSSQMIKFDYPNEVLLSVSGYHGSMTGDETRRLIQSLTFHTNKGKYGPYGEETGTFFTSSKIEGKIIGFHGRSGCYLNSIGVRVQK